MSQTLLPDRMARIGTVDERYQSYNVEMLEVTGGRFWRPFSPELEAAIRQPAPAPSAASGGEIRSGVNPALYEYRPPIDLTNARLRKLAAALGPAYVRVSGTWANTTYLPETDQAPAKPPPGFGGIHQQWKTVVDFSKAVDAGIVTSCDGRRHSRPARRLGS
jgi:heparanase 1